MDLKGKKVIIIGAGRSGMAASRLVVGAGGQVKISDKNPTPNTTEEFNQWAKAHQVEMEWGGHTRTLIEASDLVVISPGVRIDSEPVLWARAKHIPVWGEIELAYRFCSKPIIAVTGSNGKTTVSTLIKEVLVKAGRNACLCGNVGSPFSQYVTHDEKIDFFVLEISSFQLESIEKFKPNIAVFLNFNKNHLDRHKDMQEYFKAKKRIFKNQTSRDFAVLNAQDPRVSALGTELKSLVHYFNRPEDSKTTGIDNPNHLAAIAAVQILNIAPDICKVVFRHFRGVEHRMEWVRTLNGVDYVNDSKATTAEAGRWALKNTGKPLIMICGGRDKNIDFTVLRDIVRERVKKMFVIGEAREKIKKAFVDIVALEECDQLDTAVQQAQKNAAPGDCVLLSPMCTSFDMFKDFEDRGRHFKDIVNKLEGQPV